MHRICWVICKTSDNHLLCQVRENLNKVSHETHELNWMYKSLNIGIWITGMVSVEQQIDLRWSHFVLWSAEKHCTNTYESLMMKWQLRNEQTQISYFVRLKLMTEWMEMIAVSNCCCVKSGDGREVNWKDIWQLLHIHTLKWDFHLSHSVPIHPLYPLCCYSFPAFSISTHASKQTPYCEPSHRFYPVRTHCSHISVYSPPLQSP